MAKESKQCVTILKYLAYKPLFVSQLKFCFWIFLPGWRTSHGQGQWRQRNDYSDENDRWKIRNIDNHHKKFEFGQFVGDFVEIFWPGSKWKCWVILESQGQNAEANSRTWTAKLQIHLFEAVWKMKRNRGNLFNERQLFTNFLLYGAIH